MRILFVNLYYLPYRGGIERVIEKLSTEFLKSQPKAGRPLDEKGVERVGILTTKYEFPRKYRKDLEYFEKINGTRVFRIDSLPHKAPPFYQVPLVWFSPWDFQKVIENFKPDVIQLMTDKWFWGNLWSWWYGSPAKRGGKRAKIVFSLSFHGLGYGRLSNPITWLAKQLLRPINLLLTNAADKVHSVSEFERKMIQKAYFTKKNKFFITPWGVELVKSSKLKVKSYKKKDEVIILCVGRLSKHKGQAWLLERYINCLSLFNVATKLAFIGKDEGSEPSLKFKVQSSKLDRNVKILGEVSEEELNEWYEKADIFAMFPEYEAFGLVFLEAMGRGVPVLTHKVGALQEILKNKAVLVDEYNEKQAENALVELVNNKKGREEKGSLAHQYVKENFSWKKTADEFLKIYKSL